MTKSRRLSAIVLLIVISSALAAIAKDDAGPQSTLSFAVIRDDNGKAVRNAAVVLHPVGPHGKQSKGGFELKTDNEGKTHFDGIPYGTLRVQVIAPGFQTFGNDYSINQAAQEIAIRLKRPRNQYSIYENHDGSTSGKTDSNTGTSNPSGSAPPKDQH